MLAVAIVALASGCGDEDAGVSPESSESASRLFLAGKRELLAVDVDRETVERHQPSQLSPGDPPHLVLGQGERVVIWGGRTAHALDPDLEREPEPLVVHESFIVFIPSTHPERVWIGLVDPETPRRRPLSAVREVSVDGQVTVPDRRPPRGRWPEAATDEGLLFADHSEPGERGVLVWDPESGEVVRRLPGLTGHFIGPTSGDLLASAGEPFRELHLTEVSTGEQQRIEAPGGFVFEDPRAGEFSPGGALLAIPVRPRASQSEDTHYEEPDADAPRQLALIDPASGALRIVEGSRVPNGYNLIAWSSSGDEVVITGGR